MAAPTLLGRKTEIRRIEELVADVRVRGGVLVLRGEAGIGKSTLLEMAQHHARARGMLTLTTSGVQAEAHLPFAGLHQLLLPILTGIPALPPPQRAAIESAFGLAIAAPPDRFLIALAALDLLAEAAERAPLLLVAEDAHWLDRPTCDVLAFVARRLEAEPIAMLVALRDGFEHVLFDDDLPQLPLARLDSTASEALLRATAPALAPDVRARLLTSAAGNPLALVELPAALHAEQRSGAVPFPEYLPPTARLERAFAAQVSQLPPPARALLLAAALNNGDSLTEALRAANLRESAALTAIESVTKARVLVVDGVALRFRHPLIRSAVLWAASISERHTMHSTLALVLAEQPDRAIWHRAAATIGTDEGIADDLEAAARRAQQRGAGAVAVEALARAARLTDVPARQGQLRLGAAELAFELGQPALGRQFLHQAEPVALAPREQRRLAWARELLDEGLPSDAPRIRTLAALAEQALLAGDRDLASDFIWAAGLRCWWADVDDEVRGRVIAVAERVHDELDAPRLLSILAYVAPIRRGALVIERAARRAPHPADNPGTMRLLGHAAATVGDFELAAQFLTAAAAGLRDQGRLAHLAQVLALRSWAALRLMRRDMAAMDAEEGYRLARETGQPVWMAGARSAAAMLAGIRGDEETAEMLAAEAERVALPLGAGALLSVVQLARGITAIGGGRHADAYEHLRRMFDHADPAYHEIEACWAIGNLAEAAVQSGHRDEARVVLRELELLAAQTPSPGVQVALRHARPLLADHEEAEALFVSALAADLRAWPFDRARLLLAYGEWLRRQRRAAEARAPLRAAREAFDTLDATPWGGRARRELRAAGETSRLATIGVADRLSPQELQIAQLAAEGLTNREIGQRLYLSPRTIGSHLYRIFPKLGITARAELHAALER